MVNAIHQALLQACRNFMIPIARFLLRHGIPFKEFAEVAKWAFVHVATEEYGIRGRKASISRVALLTGLSRKEVSRCRIEPAPGGEMEVEWRIASEVLRTWHIDANYIDNLGNPAVLPLEGQTSFASLVDSVTREREPDEVLALLLEADAVEPVADGLLKATTRYYMPPYSDVRAIHYFGEALRNLATTIENNYDKRRGITRFERFVYSNSLPSASKIRFQRILSEQASKLLEVLDDWLSAHETPKDDLGKVGVGIYYFDSSDPRLDVGKGTEESGTSA
jgi:hypothetical protein